jgi:hypothetical protein
MYGTHRAESHGPKVPAASRMLPLPNHHSGAELVKVRLTERREALPTPPPTT